MSEPWHKFCLAEIDGKFKSGAKKPSVFEKEFIGSIRRRIELSLSLTEKQEKCLVKIHERITDLRRLKW